jgi:hypothetical protein
VTYATSPGCLLLKHAGVPVSLFLFFTIKVNKITWEFVQKDFFYYYYYYYYFFFFGRLICEKKAET